MRKVFTYKARDFIELNDYIDFSCQHQVIHGLFATLNITRWRETTHEQHMERLAERRGR